MNWLETLINEKGTNRNQLAKVADLHHSTLDRIITHNVPFDRIYLTTASAIAKGFGCKTKKEITEFIGMLFERFGDDGKNSCQ